MLNFCKNYAQSKMCGWLEILLKKLKTFPSKNQNLPMPTKNIIKPPNLIFTLTEWQNDNIIFEHNKIFENLKRIWKILKHI